MASRSIVLAGDLGAGSLRLAAVNGRGEVLAAESVPLSVLEPRPGWAELHPTVWWQALKHAAAKVLEALPKGGSPAGLCLTGMTRSQVLLDADGAALRPAILFRDRRAAEEGREAAAHFPTDNPADAIGAFHPLGRLAWVARHEPEVFARIGRLLDPKDYLNFRLTGVQAADFVTSSRFDALQAEPGPLPGWLARALELLAAPRLAPWACVGAVSSPEPPFDRLAGLPVFAGAMDTWAAAVGSGAVEAGQAYDVAGTSEAVGLIVASRVEVPALVAIRWGENVWQIGGPTQAGADCARWGHDTFRAAGSLQAAVERAGTRTPAEEAPLFLPYLAGERTPLWREDVRGALVGLGRAAGPDLCLWSVLEGVAHAVRDILGLACAGSGQALVEVLASGGGARSDAWCQLKADVLGVPVARAADPEPGVLGAAVTALVGIGRYPDLAAAVRTLPLRGACFKPRQEYRSVFARRAEMYQRLKAAALELSVQGGVR